MAHRLGGAAGWTVARRARSGLTRMARRPGHREAVGMSSTPTLGAATAPPRLPPAPVIKSAWRIHRLLYRVSGGRFLWTPANKRGWGALRLTTTGRRSGADRSVILAYLTHGDGWSVVAMNGGYPATPPGCSTCALSPPPPSVSRVDRHEMLLRERRKAQSGRRSGRAGSPLTPTSAPGRPPAPPPHPSSCSNRPRRARARGGMSCEGDHSR
ncbi:hypothetical protein BN11_760005 [Nostocoides australiense Ben110]|uniref:Uncharacterized protein n=1 Tax=Nostocoides australiense Ben110 TaxID=1193182 RepID=W6K4S1_9MICO|nr:hypothetical protein BN11_760005 [Tetrasphaera australiensis Ben110]